jgi:hypothetical protein
MRSRDPAVAEWLAAFNATMARAQALEDKALAPRPAAGRQDKTDRDPAAAAGCELRQYSLLTP